MCVSVYMYIHIYKYICVCVYIYLHVYVYRCICTHIPARAPKESRSR